MKSATIAATALMGIAPFVSAHYTFSILVIDGVESADWEYIRENTRAEQYMPTKFINSPSITPLDDDFRCNEGSFTNAANTKTAEVTAGSSLAMKLFVDAKMQHPGPAQVYMSKAPGAVQEYEGDGDWFKIFEETTCKTSSGALQDEDWCSWDKDSIEFTIPADTPDGEYLVRSEHVGLHGAHEGEAEFYYSCAQVKVTGGGSGSPSPVVKFPGAYTAEDEGITFSVWGGVEDYPYSIGPEVWSGGGSASNSSSSPSSDAAPSGAVPSGTGMMTALPIASGGTNDFNAYPTTFATAYSAPAAPSAAAPVVEHPPAWGAPAGAHGSTNRFSFAKHDS